MSDEPLAPSAGARDAGRQASAINRLLLFFALVYVVEGLGQIVGLISQPLNYYLKEVQGWTPLQITAFITRFQPALDHQAGLRPDLRFRAAVRLSAQKLSDHRQYRGDRRRLSLGHAARSRQATFSSR